MYNLKTLSQVVYCSENSVLIKNPNCLRFRSECANGISDGNHFFYQNVQRRKKEVKIDLESAFVGCNSLRSLASNFSWIDAI